MHWHCTLKTFINVFLGSLKFIFVKVQTSNGVSIYPNLHIEGSRKNFLEHRKGKYVVRKPEICIV